MTIPYSGNGVLVRVACGGASTDILTGSILSVGSATGICLGDTDLGVSTYSPNTGPDSGDSDISSNWWLGSKGTRGYNDSCEAYVVSVWGDCLVVLVSDAHAYLTWYHSGVHSAEPGMPDVTAPIVGAGENDFAACVWARVGSELSGTETEVLSNEVVWGFLDAVDTVIVVLWAWASAALMNEESETVI